MTRSASSRVPCDGADAKARLRQDEAFALLADLDPFLSNGSTRSAAVSNAVLAGIAASDSICSRYLKQRSASSNHTDALLLLAQTVGRGHDAATHLNVLLCIKKLAQYEAPNPTVSETKRVMRAMRSLMDIAQAF